MGGLGGLGGVGGLGGLGSSAGTAGAGGGPGPLSTLVLPQSFASNPDAMVMVTDAISDPSDTTLISRSWPVATNFADATRLDRWEPWVRTETCLQELLSRTFIDPVQNGAGLALWHLDKNALAFASGALSGNAFPIVEMIAPPQSVFEGQVALVIAWQELRAERLSEIFAQLDPQFDLWAAVACLHPTRTPRTLELINIALRFTVSIEMRFKHAIGAWRPFQLNAQVQPVLTTPGHGAFPSGHATQAFMVARLLQRFLWTRVAGVRTQGLPDTHPVVVQLFRQAARIATNRVVAGVHYPIDSIGGRLLGVALADYFVASCVAGESWTPRTFDGAQTVASLDLHPELQPLSGGAQAPYYVEHSPAVTAASSPLMTVAWDRSQSEWDQFNF